MARIWHVPVIEVGPDGFLSSLRNNVFYNHPTKFANGTATVRPGFAEMKTTPAPARPGYADYNLFFNPDAAFGKHDAPANGATDAQVEPKFAGPIPKKFPFSDDDLKAGKVTVSKVLA